VPVRDGIEVRLQRVSLHRGQRPILEQLDWHLRPGQRWLLTGANGAGKTQLLKLVAGAVWPDPDEVSRRRYRWRGHWHDSPVELGDAIAYLGPERQERYERYGWNFTVRSVVATGCTHTDIPDRPLRSPERRRVARLLREFGLERLARRRFLTLSYGQRRLTLLARALAGRPQWLLLDELFGGLDDMHRTQLASWFEGAGRRHNWVLATHRPDEAPRSVTHCVELDAGRLVRRRCAAVRDAGRRAVPRLLVAAPPRAPLRLRTALVEFERASVYIDWQPVLHELQFTIGAGEGWVVHGANGAGKTTLLRAIWGDLPVARGGQVRRRGIEPGVPLEVFQRRSGFVAPHQHALQPPGASVIDVVVSGLRNSVGLDTASRAAERRRALRLLGDVGLEARAHERFHALSWGTARRVLLARAAIARPRLLLLDEPCAGLDPGARSAIRADVDRLIAQGVAVVISGHHRDEWPTRAGYEIELDAGRLRYAGPLRQPESA
jgi:molybdate transport system ATP-binding protein